MAGISPVSPVSPLILSATPEEFNYQTKFIVLNFLSKQPFLRTERATFSPQASDSDYLNFGKTLSKSLPPSPPKKISPLMRNKRDYLQKKLSEDNIQHRHETHRRHLKKTKPSQGSPLLAPSSADDTIDGPIPAGNNRSKHECGIKTLSELTADNEFTYVSDADDEYEDSHGTVDGSSLFSSYSGSNLSNGHVQESGDLLRVVSRLPTVKSASEFELDEVDSQTLLVNGDDQNSIPSQEDNKPTFTNGSNLETKGEDEANIYEDDFESDVLELEGPSSSTTI